MGTTDLLLGLFDPHTSDLHLLAFLVALGRELFVHCAELLHPLLGLLRLLVAALAELLRSFRPLGKLTL